MIAYINGIPVIFNKSIEYYFSNPVILRLIEKMCNTKFQIFVDDKIYALK